LKGGLHGGGVRGSVDGVGKKDIVYHGDGINTTARIQSMCNELKASLLISDHLLEALSRKRDYNYIFKGQFTFKRKRTPNRAA